ncbi:MAG: hypothetical protein ACREE6_06410 [Limisphaerales bacterium]
MKKHILTGTVIMAASLLAAYAGPKDDVTSAAQKLQSGGNYSWQITVVVPAKARFKPGPIKGKIQGNLTDEKMSARDNTIEFIMNGTNVAITDPDDGSWEKLSDVDTSGFGRFLVERVRNFQAPPAQAEDLVADVQSLQQNGNSYSGTLTEDGAKKLLTFGRGRRGGGPSVSNPSGTVTFSLEDGQLTKFEYHVKGTMTFRGNDFPVDNDTTVAISDVGTTKINVPEDAKKLLPSSN